ncbi:MAG: TIGR02186 family protein, partial [Desulfobacterales bacterium]|nr:TIGR02186 family protein [Pseudomonadota bacterium]MCG2773020.1 TIGR02186 family protein [Desulfobacterales bacterium]
VIEITGPAATEHLMRKGRRGGLWMNVGGLEVQGAPSLYLASSTTPPLLKVPPEEATWGYPALKKQIRFAGRVEQREREMFLDQFFQLKESEEVYAIFPGTLKVKGGSGDSQTVTGAFPLPTKVKPGAYRVCLTVVQGGQVIAKQCSDLKVAMVGFPAMLASLAYEHGATYGILAVIIAIVTGFAMGYLFKGGGGH